MGSNKRTFYVKRSISQVVDDPNKVVQLEQLFLAGSARPRRKGSGAPGAPRKRDAAFYRNVAKVAQMVADQIGESEDAVLMITNDDQPGAGGRSLVKRSIAERLILQGTHRLATVDELNAANRG